MTAKLPSVRSSKRLTIRGCLSRSLPLAMTLVLVAMTAATVRADGSPGQSNSSGKSSNSGPSKGQEAKARVDAAIAELLGQGNDDARPRVIITVKPGAKNGLLRALMAHGATISQDYAMTEASAGGLQLGLVRKLLREPDVVTISSDAVVEGSGITTAVTGTSANSTYSLRATLGIQNSTLTGIGIAVAVIDSGIHPSGD